MKEENHLMKISLTKLQNQINAKEDQLMNFNKHLLKIKHEQRLSNPINIMALHLQPQKQ